MLSHTAHHFLRKKYLKQHRQRDFHYAFRRKGRGSKQIAEGESEYMRILGDAYNTPERAEFYEFDRALEAAKTAMSGSDKTLILPKDSPLASIFMGEE